MDTGIFIGDKIITTSWDKIWNKPNTLSGYGITDAVTIDTHQQIYGTKEFRQTVFIDTQSDVKLIMRDDDNHALIGAANSEGSVLSRLGYYGDRWGIDGYKILTTNNYSAELDNRYVNKAGDTVTGIMDFKNKVIVNSSVQGGTPSISLAIGDSDSGFNSASDGHIQIYTNNVVLADLNNGSFTFKVNPYVNGNKIYHAGNDGSGSGLDADLLDGKHLGNVGDRVMRQIGFPDFNEFGSTDTNVYLRKVLGWCYNNVNTGAADSLFIGVGHPNSLGNMQIQVYCSSGINEEGYPRYSTGVYFPLGSNPIIFGTNENNYWQKTLACISDNVASATRLVTPRTIFSKPFDGTGNVTGGAKFANICIETDNNGNDSGRSSEINNYVGPLQLQQASPNGIHMCMGGGQVGICTTSPKYTLHVDGVIYAKNGFRETSDIRKKKVLTSHTVDLDDMAYADLFDYTLIDDEKEIVRIGTNAHYWLDKLPQVVTKDNDEYLSLNYGVLGTVCALSVSKYVKQLEDRVTLLENKIASLQ